MAVTIRLCLVPGWPSFAWYFFFGKHSLKKILDKSIYRPRNLYTCILNFMNFIEACKQELLVFKGIRFNFSYSAVVSLFLFYKRIAYYY